MLVIQPQSCQQDIEKCSLQLLDRSPKFENYINSTPGRNALNRSEPLQEAGAAWYSDILNSLELEHPPPSNAKKKKQSKHQSTIPPPVTRSWGRSARHLRHMPLESLGPCQAQEWSLEGRSVALWGSRVKRVAGWTSTVVAVQIRCHETNHNQNGITKEPIGF